jgi:hypothetical protein
MMIFKVMVDGVTTLFYHGNDELQAFITYNHMCKCSDNGNSAYAGDKVRLYHYDNCIREYVPVEGAYNLPHTD